MCFLSSKLKSIIKIKIVTGKLKTGVYNHKT